ncbi:MAG: hypothetical protein U1F77_17260 [Kiritimatiellia bacterium]
MFVRKTEDAGSVHGLEGLGYQRFGGGQEQRGLVGLRRPARTI